MFMQLDTIKARKNMDASLWIIYILYTFVYIAKILCVSPDLPGYLVTRISAHELPEHVRNHGSLLALLGWGARCWLRVKMCSFPNLMDYQSIGKEKVSKVAVYETIIMYQPLAPALVVLEMPITW